VAKQRLENYLRTYRKQSGLSQTEVAFLLGHGSDQQISRYEKRRRVPPIGTALQCEVLFGVPVSELFAGIHEVASNDVKKRMRELRAKLLADTTKGDRSVMTAHKLRWLAGRESFASAENATS